MRPDFIRCAESFGLRLANFCDAVAIALVAVFTVTTAAAVFFRYVVGDALTWSDELARYTMVAMVFVAATPALRSGEHIAVDVLQRALPPRLAAALSLVIAALMAGFLVVLAVQGIRLMIATSAQTTPSLGLSRAVPYAIIPAGAVLMLLQLAVLSLRQVLKVASSGAENETARR